MAIDPRCLAAARQCTATRLRRATRIVARLYEEAMAPSGLEDTQFTLLVALSLAGETSMRKLAGILGIDRTTLTRNLVPLARNGMIESAAGSDQRVRLVRLTALGRKTLHKALPLWEKAQQRVVNELGKTRWNDLLALLQAIEALAAD
jgi:DNA-binding MarR family transcriptional regulator